MPLAGLIPLVLVAAALIWVLVASVRAGRGAGQVIVRCRAGHLFTTTWMPLMSFKAIRLGPLRYQYCPVGQHFSLVMQVNEADLSPDELEQARRFHDTLVP